MRFAGQFGKAGKVFATGDIATEGEELDTAEIDFVLRRGWAESAEETTTKSTTRKSRAGRLDDEDD